MVGFQLSVVIVITTVIIVATVVAVINAAINIVVIFAKCAKQHTYLIHFYLFIICISDTCLVHPPENKVSLYPLFARLYHTVDAI